MSDVRDDRREEAGMTGPDANPARVKRETDLEAPPAEVWEALTEEDRLAEWLGDDVELDPVEGGELTVRTDGEERTGTIDTVEEERRLALTWARPGEAETSVEFTLEPCEVGTHLTVVETNAIGGPTASALNLAWHRRLVALRKGMLRVPV
jgi:uncharacterized protein YndB with AHSA1/START domain